MNGVRVQSPLKSWIFSGFFTQLHKLRSLRRSFLHFQLNDWCISVVAVPVGWSALPKMWQSNLWSSSIDTLLYKSSETDRPSEPCLWRRLSVTCRATKKIKFHRYADMRGTLQWYSRYNGHEKGRIRAKTAERNSKTCEWICRQLVAKTLNVNSVQLNDLP